MVKPTDGFISRYINRKISTKISGFILSRDLPITPNQMTVVSFLISLLSSAAYVLGAPWLGGTIAQISSIVDGVDGEIARAKGISSRFGAFFDTILDRYSDLVVIIGASFYVCKTIGVNTYVAMLLVLAVSGDILVSYLHSVGREHLGEHPGKIGKLPSFASRDVRIFVLFVFSLFDKVLYGLTAIAVMSYVYSLVKTVEICILKERAVSR